jgi:hypothetical protein
MQYIVETDNIIQELVSNDKKIPIERYYIMNSMMNSMDPQQNPILTEEMNNIIINFNNNKNIYLNNEINRNNKRNRIHSSEFIINKK